MFGVSCIVAVAGLLLAVSCWKLLLVLFAVSAVLAQLIIVKNIIMIIVINNIVF